MRLEFAPNKILRTLEPFEGEWRPYNPTKPGYGRWGLSLTSLDGGMSGVPDLYSLKEYNATHGTSYAETDFRTPTPALEAGGDLRHGLERLGPLGRSHLLRLGRGGFFPPHRDTALLRPECFRVLANLNFSSNSHSLIINDRQYFLEPGLLHIVNTTLSHSLVSFVDFSHFLVLNLPLTVESVEKVTDLLAQN